MGKDIRAGQERATTTDLGWAETPRVCETLANLCDRGDDRLNGITDLAFALERELNGLRRALGALEFNTSADAYYNLMGARTDIEEGRGDAICNDTLRRVERQLGACRAAIAKAEGTHA